jgi:hypothetical protein
VVGDDLGAVAEPDAVGLLAGRRRIAALAVRPAEPEDVPYVGERLFEAVDRRVRDPHVPETAARRRYSSATRPGAGPVV